MNDRYLTVSQLTRYIKYRIDNDNNLQDVFLKGEISNFKAHTRGHYYFTLKDETSRIKAIMFQSQTKALKFIPEDGMKVMLTGKVSVYEATGDYQIYVNEMVEDGVGNLYVAFEQLKKKLEQEGLFRAEHKKKIPRIPSTIGIITAPTGAAIRDILSTIKRRWPLARTILFPSLVQGKDAASDIVANIKKAENFPLDVLIIGRGGGSIEDMWCFNEEEVARAIYDCPVPVISAVGHEIDFTISDFVADLRAPTPTGAAEMAVPSLQEVTSSLKQLQIRLSKKTSHTLEVARKNLEQVSSRYVLKNPMSLYERKEQAFDYLLERLKTAMNTNLATTRSKLQTMQHSWIFGDPKHLYQKASQDYQGRRKDVFRASEKYLEGKKHTFLHLLGKVETLNPLLTIKRGYAIIKEEERVISSIKEVSKGQIVTITLQDGTIKSEVL